MAIMFRMLGPVEVAVDGQPRNIPGRNPKAVLVSLLMDVGWRATSLEVLSASIWGSRPPASAVANLRTYVATLRTALGPDARVTTRPGGYTIAASADDSDHLRFRQLRATAIAVHHEDPVHSATLLSEALDLWRGAAAEDLPRRGALGEVLDQLDQERLRAIEELAEVQLQVGSPTELITPLERLVADEPTRERAWELLALAYDRCGESEAALRAVSRARGALCEMTGLEPGRALREIQRSILLRGGGPRPAAVRCHPRRESAVRSRSR